MNTPDKPKQKMPVRRKVSYAGTEPELPPTAQPDQTHYANNDIGAHPLLQQQANRSAAVNLQAKRPQPASETITSNERLPLPAATDQAIPVPSISKRLLNTSPYCERLVLPSQCIFYDFSSVEVRPMTAIEITKITIASERRSITDFIDVLDATIDVDLRSLWITDYRYFLYWHRLNSYIQVPYTARWTSFYGNRNRVRIDRSSTTTRVLQMTREQYSVWNTQHGLSIPDVRTLEEYINLNDGDTQGEGAQLSPLEDRMFATAQFMSGANIREKLDAMAGSQLNSELFRLVGEFRTGLKSGDVNELASVRDAHFESGKVLETLRFNLKKLDDILETELTDETEEFITARRTLTQSEITRIESEIALHGEAEPMLETIPMNIAEFNFFPTL